MYGVSSEEQGIFLGVGCWEVEIKKVRSLPLLAKT
jgi:hypothetical protein